MNCFDIMKSTLALELITLGLQSKIVSNYFIHSLLYNTLMNGSIKLYVKQYSNLSNLKYIIKISGVWENDKEVGITYKFLEISDLQQ